MLNIGTKSKSTPLESVVRQVTQSRENGNDGSNAADRQKNLTKFQAVILSLFYEDE